MSPSGADSDEPDDAVDFPSAEGRAATFLRAAADFGHLREAPAHQPQNEKLRHDAAKAALRYVNELAITARHRDVPPVLDWLQELASRHTGDIDLGVAVATAMFDHINNLGVGQHFDSATAELHRLKAFVARYPGSPQIQVRFESASENLERMIGWVESEDPIAE